MPARLSSSNLARTICHFLSEQTGSAAAGRPIVPSSTASSIFPPSLSRSRRLRPTLFSSPSTSSFHTESTTHAAATVLSRHEIALPEDYVPPTQPPTARQPDTRKAQLLRTYASLVRSTPLILIFQHNNLTGPEWAALRRELTLAQHRATDEQKLLGMEWPNSLAPAVRLQVVRKGIFSMALRLAEFYDPATVTAEATRAATSAVGKRFRGPPDVVYNHDLSAAAYISTQEAEAAAAAAGPDTSAFGQLAPLLIGPLAVLSFPVASPAHLAAALSVLTPKPPAFPAPSRKKVPTYYDMHVQSGLQKLLLVGGRVEGKVFDLDGVRWVGSIKGGRSGLQAQLMAMLQSAGLGLAASLEGASKSLWLTMESRKSMLDEGGEKGEKNGSNDT